MPEVCIDLSEKEYEILTALEDIKGNESEKLRSLFRYYLYTVPALRGSYYALKRTENKDEIEDVLRDVLAAYKDAEHPILNWEGDKLNKLIDELTEINVLSKVDEAQTLPKRKFNNLFKKLLHDIATERKDMDERIAAYVAIIQLLIEFGVGTLSKETIRDATIFLNDGWYSVYPEAMKGAREFEKTRRLSMKLKPYTKKQPLEIKL